MSNRRNFIKHSGSLALGGYLLSRNTELFTALANKSVHPIGIQLYTVTGLMDNDTRSSDWI
jgi:hypothetical protein